MEQNLKIMTVVCHPADAIDHAGGTLCLHALRGDSVTVVVCTHGVTTHDFRRREALGRGEEAAGGLETAISAKAQEVRDGLAILGVHDVRFLGFRDDLVSASPELIEAIAVELADVQPHLLLLHNPTEELGFAHGETAVAALKARPVANTPAFLKKPAGHAFPVQIFFMTMYGHTNQLANEGLRYGDVVVDITPVVDRKVRAMDCLKSQFYTGAMARKCVEVVNGRMGLHMRMSYAESFQSFQPGGYAHLPINDHLMRLAHTAVSVQLEGLQLLAGDEPLSTPRNS